MRIEVAEIARRLGGELRNVPEGTKATSFVLDSRSARPGGIFLAIRGARHDGHDSVPEALASGCVASIVERAVPGPHVLVGNLVDSLASMAASYRNEFHGPVVGVTGSNGKTTTKEFAAAALGGLGTVLKNPGNRNTEYTAPLVWPEAPGKSAAVIEMAMRGHGQIAHLAGFTRPNIAVVTNIGTSHIEKVGSREGILDAKSEIFLPGTDQTAILWREDDFYSALRERAPGPILTFGASEDADVRVTGYRAMAWDRSAVLFSYAGRSSSIELPVLGRRNALNAAAAVTAATVAGVPFEQAVLRLGGVELPPMRMQAVEHNGAIVLLDTYNASPDSMVAAIEALAEMPCEGRRIAVLGEMRELGSYSETGHRRVGAALGLFRLDSAMLIGPETETIRAEAAIAHPGAKVTQDNEVDIIKIREFLDTLREGDVALVKGSRALGLERALEDS
ncbi:MAG: UDP-N-acetylmuramoyl-tripeptide--D-alanyl-D-alanine ligase [Fimbriimonadaceae bacterium]|nr:UDP-N-acetylmuramoyl-tripeptide--D-alanyl-D-alanine ligase [Fimbriimonadaceae bacterium]